MKKGIIILLAIVFGAIFIKFSYSSFMSMINKQNRAKASIPMVTVEEINEENVHKEFDAPGRVASKYQVNVVARVDGYLVKSYFKEGDVVKKGQVLFEIEGQHWELTANKAKSNYDKAKANLLYSEKQLARAQELVKKDYIAKAQYDKILSERDANKAQLALANNEYRDALRNLNYTKVKAPVDGRIGIIAVTLGNYVSANSQTLTTIYSSDPIYVTFPINAEDYTTLLKNDKIADVKRKVEGYFADGSKYELAGIQDFHDNKVDSATGTITMRATFPNPKGLLMHGDYMKIHLFSKEKANVPVVPLVAVLENPQGKYVYIVDNKNIVDVRYIETAGQFGDYWIVKSGLQKGDRIVVSGVQKVIPQKPVKIVSQDEIDNETEKATKEAEQKEESLEENKQ